MTTSSIKHRLPHTNSYKVYNILVDCILGASLTTGGAKFVISDGSEIRSKTSVPLDLDATESRTDPVTSTTPADEVAMESSTKSEVESPEEGGMAADGSEDSAHYEMELMTGDGADDSDEAYSEVEDEEGDASPESQHLFPSFSALFPPLGHSRPSTFFTETPIPPPPPRTFQTESFHRAIYSSEDTDRMLGSGNFGVISGGTYYGGIGDEIPFLRGPNSHSRPYRRPNPLPQYRHGGDFFAGFRDFADITTPAKPSYSQIYVVYANRNSTTNNNGNNNNNNNIGRPKNIRELLEGDEDVDSEEKTKSKTKKKLNQYKEKTAAIEASKKYRGLSKDFNEPLLALS